MGDLGDGPQERLLGETEEARTYGFEVLGTRDSSQAGLCPISLIPSGEEKIDGCHWGINMAFFFSSLTLEGQVPLARQSLHGPPQP